MVDLLLQHGADIDARSDWWAGSFGVLDSCDPEFAAFLIERGATVDAHAAARLGMLDRLKALVAANPKVVHGRGGDGQTPLHFASTPEIATFLLEHGADIDARDVDHESTPAQYMIRDRQDVARLLVTRGCKTDILMAAALGATDLVRRYLDDNPASIRTRVSREFFPMRHHHAGGTIYTWTLGGEKSPHVIALEFGHEDVYQLLMERSPDTMKLTEACAVGDEALVKTLLAQNSQLAKSLSKQEQSRLAVAAQSNNANAVRLMLDAGWPLDARGELGGTALHHAAWMGNADIVRDLLQYGAPVEIRGDTYDMTPMGWALHGSENSWRKDIGDYDAVVQLLLDAGAKMPTMTTEIP
jgi:ankyrin repeat protein